MHTLSTTLSTVGWLTISIASAWCQSPLEFYPYAQGNVWQYRDASTQEILGRRYNDSVWFGTDASIHIRVRFEPGHVIRQEKIDTSFNVFNLSLQPDHPRYKLAADSGETWFAGYDPADSSRHFEVTLSDIFHGYVFNVVTTIKEFTFNMIQFAGTDTLELGKEYLSSWIRLGFRFDRRRQCPLSLRSDNRRCTLGGANSWRQRDNKQTGAVLLAPELSKSFQP